MEVNQYVDFIGGLAEENQVELSDSEIQEIIDKYNKLAEMVTGTSNESALQDSTFFRKQIEMRLEERRKIEKIKQLLLEVNTLYKLIYPDAKPHYYFDDTTPESTQISFTVLRRIANGGPETMTKTITAHFEIIITRFKHIFEKFKCDKTKIPGKKCFLRVGPDAYIETKISSIQVDGHITLKDLTGGHHPSNVYRSQNVKKEKKVEVINGNE